jgi:hypothetical protein
VDLALLPKLTGLLIPLVAILGALLLPVGIVYMALHFRQRQREKLYETVKHFADRGMPVPAELLDPPRREQAVYGTLRFRAFTLIGVGVGLALMFWGLDLNFLLGVGGLLVCIGVAQLIALKLEAGEPASPSAPRPGA